MRKIVRALCLMFSMAIIGSVSCEAADFNQGGIDIDSQVESALQSMNVEEKIGQMMMIGVHGTEVDEAMREKLQRRHFGGVILFDRNIESSEQVKKFTADLQTAAGSPIPLLLAIDEEGGYVSHGSKVIKTKPSQAKLAQLDDTEAVREAAVQTAREMHALGMNLNFAPVADVGDLRGKPERTFGTEAGKAAACVAAAADGYESENMLYALKHFPGIGKGEIDSHKDISTIKASKKILFREDLLPFRQIITTKNSEDYLIMVSHLRYAALDSKHVASLSRKITTNLLRKRLGFQGVVITDDLNMGAVAKYEKADNLGVKAILAGADIALLCHKPQEQDAMYDNLLAAYKNGRLSEERINASVRRILKLKLTHLR